LQKLGGHRQRHVLGTSPDLPDDDYVLGRTSQEYQRLRWQARLWEPITARVLDQVGIGPGMRRLDAWTRPGGVMLVQEFDAHTMDIWPRLATWEEFERVLYGVFEKTGRDPRFGQKLPLHVAAAGLGGPDGTDVAGLLLPLVEIGVMFQAVYQSIRPVGLRLGLTTEADGQAFLAEIAEAAHERRGVGMSPLLVSVWKRKPPEPDTRPTRESRL